MSQEIRDFFMEEAVELFDNLNSILLKNEEAGNISPEEIDSLFRDVHTLKGGAGSVELVKFSGYTHHLETFMDMVRNKEISLNPKVMDFLIEGVSSMQDILTSEYENSIDEDLYQKQMKDLLQDIDHIQNENKPVDNTEQASINDNNLNEEMKKAFGNHAAEMIDLFDKLEYKIEIVDSQEEKPEDCVDGIFRIVHTLKGSSQFLNLKYFPIYLHDVETFLDKARNKEIPYTLEFNDFMKNILIYSKNLIDIELNNALDENSFKKEISSLKEDIDELTLKLTQSNNEQNDDSDKSLAFELFDEPVEDKKEKAAPLAFELFDEPIKKEEKSSEVTVEKPTSIKKEVPKDTTKTAKTENVSLNKAAAAASIRVNLDKIDQLMNRVGDLVITKSMLFQFAESLDSSSTLHKDMFDRLSNLDRDIRELQESVMSVRMVPMKSLYSRLPKMVRDLSKKLDKKIKFESIGENVEIDKMMVEGLMDPLTHIIRNSLDHGIEKPEARHQKGKSRTGRLIISAQQESGNIIISIKDDGAGINIDKVIEKALEKGAITQEELSRMNKQDKLMVIFHPGLSTAESITDVSGRGVGMDVVMNNINSLGGHIKILSKKDKGTEIQIILPLTLAILDGLNVVIGDNKFILPLNSIVESLQPKQYMVKHIGENKKEILMLRKEFIPIIRLYDFFSIEPRYSSIEEGMLIIVKTASNKVALFVDDFLKQEQIVVKTLEKNYKKIKGIGAATIRGDGSIGLIIDIASIVNIHKGVE